MIKKLLFAVIILGGIFAGYYAFNTFPHRIKIIFMESEMTDRSYEPVLGIYDRENKHTQLQVNEIKHYALSLNADDTWEIEKNLLQDLPDSIPVLLTVEMWDPKGLTKTQQGFNDDNIRALFSEIIKSRTNLFVRYNPEMEVPVNIYPWNNRPHIYVGAYRQFAKVIKEINPNVKMVYAPAGVAGALENYPEDDVVDVASITLNSNAENHTSFSQEPTIEKQLGRKLHRMRFLNKPVLILGSAKLDLADFQHQWIVNALNVIDENKAVIYSEENFIRPSGDWKNDSTPLILGIYDPDKLLVNEKEVEVEHIFLNFKDIENDDHISEIEKVLGRGNDVLLTVEPTWWNEEKDSDILQRISAGELDTLISRFYSRLPETDHTVYIRFAHEMEIPITRYSWQSKDPIVYIKAFRHFMNFNHTRSLNIKKIWGPAGDRGLLEWWPGNDVVDYISIAIYGLPDKNITDPKKQETFSKILNRKMRRLQLLNKPVFITEFGVKGEEEFQTKWLIEAAYAIKQNPRIIGVSYFNYQDSPEVWGNIAPPKWNISPGTYREFIRALDLP
ncbi:hypothetical protein FK178_03275 [Antarcticibacterium arcticum]|uniref:GH26 domain-containing protein n=1 Tax=Antarcticibacterium arcticum TaxID=2585771 RepID=A0A5B8YM14_9FLAO|nr:hypothetical protein [Antarcticibacterium arcticum]QED36789.1 hypothetical protein FK178_03275 [Antarcticibacterium arcticum]